MNLQPNQNLVTSAATKEVFELTVKPALRFFAFSAPLRFPVNSSKNSLLVLDRRETQIQQCAGQKLKCETHLQP
jgi:hypothetical protein